MLKLNASYSKKVPAEGDFTSQSYHASIEVELPDGMTQDQLKSKIHTTFEMVRNSVESEIHAKPANGCLPEEQPKTAVHKEQPASPRQIKFMLDLAKAKGIAPAQIAAQYGVNSVEQLSKRQCSELINNWMAA